MRGERKERKKRREEFDNRQMEERNRDWMEYQKIKRECEESERFWKNVWISLVGITGFLWISNHLYRWMYPRSLVPTPFKIDNRDRMNMLGWIKLVGLVLMGVPVVIFVILRFMGPYFVLIRKGFQWAFKDDRKENDGEEDNRKKDKSWEKEI